MGASAILKSVDFTAFGINVKTIAPTQKLYQSGHAIWCERSANQLMVSLLLDWVKETLENKTLLPKGKTADGLHYSVNQEEYLKLFLTDGEIPIDDSASERALRNFTLGRKNWMTINTVRGAQASAIIYSITETAKANNLKPYDYFECLLTEIPKHLDDTDRSFLDDLLPWSPNLPATAGSPVKKK